MKRLQLALAPCLLVGFGAVLACRSAGGAEKAGEGVQLKVLKTIALGGEGRWDYLGVDAPAHRLYVPRSTHVQVVDLAKGALVGDILKISSRGAHGVALAPAQHLGFITAGRGDDCVRAFDVKTLKVTATIQTGANPDAIVYDPASKHVLAMNHTGGDIAVIDPADLAAKTVSIPVGGKLEYAVVDGAGHAFVCVEDKNEVVQIDTKANRVLAHWPVAPGDGPTGLALDRKRHRLFAGCGNQKMIVLDAKTGQVLATPTIGRGVDGVAFEPTLGVAMSANGKDGTVSVVKETAPGTFAVIQTLKTFPGARTIAVNRMTHQALLPCNVPDGTGKQTFGIVVVGATSTR
jgi:YVTN family beta-propeller protein